MREKKKRNLSPNFSVKLRKPTLDKNIGGSGKGKKRETYDPMVRRPTL